MQVNYPIRNPEADKPRASEPPARIHRWHETGMELVEVESSAGSEQHLTLTLMPGETPAAIIGRLARTLECWNATVVRLIVFGSLGVQPATLAALKQALDDPDVPVTWVEGSDCNGGPVAGMQVFAINGPEIRSIRSGRSSLGRCWNDGLATHCMMGGVGPDQSGVTPPEQALSTLHNLQAGLADVGMTMKDVARTWFFLDDILSWYDGFNRVRNGFFEQCELRPGSLPASTGVAGRNPAGAAVAAAAWGVRSNDEATRIVRVVPSPQQCPAPAYGSAFSRAVEIHSPGFRQVLVSGTASIAPDGRTLHAGDVRAQIALSMQVAGAILESRGMSFNDVSRATAYFKSAADNREFLDWLERHDLAAMPVVNACCGICRDDLLFEIELDAISVSQ
jgi:enamine deaminase RidA (YjgF/YER057c/UK114 family)